MSNVHDGGRPDPEFAENGVLRFSVPSGFSGHSKALPDNTFISIGSTGNPVFDSIAILRHNAEGKPIGEVALLQLEPGTHFILRNLLVQANGSVVIFGALGSGERALFARVLSDNTLDAGFGTNGFTIFKLKSGHVLGDRYDRSGMIARNDDSIVVAAELNVDRQNNNGGVLLSIDKDGTPEDHFGDNGVTYSEGEASFQSLGARPDGTLLVTGRRDKGGLVALYTREGEPDKSYDKFGNGYVLIDGREGYHVELFTISERADKKTLVSGYIMKGSMGSPILPILPLVALLESDGSLDKDFNDGKSLELELDSSHFASGLAVQDDTNNEFPSSHRENRKILVWLKKNITSEGALLRLDAAGRPDSTFGPDGRVYFGFDPGVHQNGFELLSDDKAVVYGSSGTVGTIARFLTR
ncbi:MAG: hypothetical protein ABWZ65_23610 [Pseudomonas mandelii]